MSNFQKSKICGNEEYPLAVVCDFIVSLGYVPTDITTMYGLESNNATDVITFQKDKLSITIPRLTCLNKSELIEILNSKNIPFQDFEDFIIDFEHRFKGFENLIDSTAQPIPDEVKKAAKKYEDKNNTEQ